MQTQLVIAKKLGFGKAELFEKTQSASEEAGKIIWAIKKKLERNAAPINLSEP